MAHDPCGLEDGDLALEDHDRFLRGVDALGIADDSAISGFFEGHGITLVACSVERNSNGRSAGFAYVQLAGREEAQEIVAKSAAAGDESEDGWHLLGRRL